MHNPKTSTPFSLISTAIIFTGCQFCGTVSSAAKKNMSGYTDIVFIIRITKKIYLYSEINTHIFDTHNYACKIIYKDFTGFVNK